MTLAFALQAAPIHRAAKPITDAQGRTRVIVDFVEKAKDVYPADSFAKFDLKKDRHQPQVQQLVTAYESRYGFRRELMTSWVGASVTAYLTPKQVEQLAADANVQSLTEDYVGEFSAPPWYPSWNGAPWTELSDWGRNAVNGKTVLPGSQRKVYIIDSGVAYHDDLSSVSARVNVENNPPVVGCYAHATHVAGIVGATAGNGKTRAGVYAGVNMVSVAGGSSTHYQDAVNGCITTDTQLYVSTLGLALDFIRWDTAVWGGFNSPAHVATMSKNSVGTGFNSDGTAQTNYSKLQQLVTPGLVWSWYWSPAVLFVQSAGNNNADACSLNSAGIGLGTAAYKTSANASTTAVDGIVVVGAIDASGAAVSGPTKSFAASEPTGLTGAGGGSNYGGCVDIWAPGQSIYSTWGYGWDSTSGATTYTGGQPSAYSPPKAWNSTVFPGNPGPNTPGYSGWAWLSGTSMAAPHVAAAAAYLADKYNLTTPIAIETALRQNWQTYSPATDPAGQPIHIVYLPN